MQIIAERKERSVHIELWLLVRGVCHYYLTLIHKMIYQLRLMKQEKLKNVWIFLQCYLWVSLLL